MELTVGKADLQKELQLCQGVVEKRSTIPILSNVLLRAADGRLQIAATDLDVTILSSTSARIVTPGGVTIEAKRLFDLAQDFTAFYEHCPVMKADEPVRTSRLALCDVTARTIEHGLDLLGIAAPQAM